MHFDFKRPLTDYGRVQRAIGALKRNRAVFADTRAPRALLNMGCGGNIKAEFCNLDYFWRPGVDVVWDVTRGLPFADGYLGGIFTEHMIEHLAFEQTQNLLNECYRVLAPGCTLRIVMPDGEIYLSEYAKHRRGEPIDMPYADRDKQNNSRATPMYSVNVIFRHHGHLFIWDAETMAAELAAAGFVAIEKQQFMTGRDEALLIDSPYRRIESLYVEAVKPPA